MTARNALCYNQPVSNRFERFTYTTHAEDQLRKRGITKAQLETALEAATVVYPSRGVFIAELSIPGKDRLALKVAYSLPHPRRPNVITVHYINRKRTRL